MKTQLLLPLVCTISFTATQAQTVHSVSMGFGSNSLEQPALLRSDVFKLTPLDPETVADHELGSKDGIQETFAFILSVGLLPFRKEGHRGPELRLGFIHAGLNERFATLRSTVRTPFDTLVSSTTGEQFLIDSVLGDNYFIKTRSERFGLDASMIWNTKGRWSLYGGFGVMGGPSFNATTEVRTERYKGVAPFGSQYVVLPQSGIQESRSETFKQGTGWWMGAYVPIGIDFTLSREHPFWKQMHLCYEMRPQLVVQGSPELDNTVGTGFLANFGIRMTL